MQEINSILDINVNDPIQNIIKNYRYNESNWFCLNPTDNKYDSTGDIGEILLSTYTKRGMILIADASVPDGAPPPSYSVVVNCAIPGDFQHTVAQTRQTIGGWGGNIYLSIIVFDFSPNEVKNGVNVTDSNGVPLKGMFTVSFIDEVKRKAVTRFPVNTYMKFVMVGSGIDPDDIGVLFYRFPVSGSYFEMLNNLQTANMNGYTRTRSQHNSFTIDNGSSFPNNIYTARNFIIPKQKINLVNNTTFSTYKIRFYPRTDLSKELINGNQQCILYGVTPTDDKCTIRHSDSYERLEGVTHMNSIRTLGNELYSFDLRNDFEFNIRDTTGTELDLPFSNILVMQPCIDITKQFLPDTHPPILPQLFTSLTGDANRKPYDYLLSNYFINFYQMYFHSNLKDIQLTWVRSYMENQDGRNGVLINDIIDEKQVELGRVRLYEVDLPTGAEYKLENWNGDALHNIYLDFY